MVDYCNIVIFVMITITNIVTDAVQDNFYNYDHNNCDCCKHCNYCNTVFVIAMTLITIIVISRLIVIIVLIPITNIATFPVAGIMQ